MGNRDTGLLALAVALQLKGIITSLMYAYTILPPALSDCDCRFLERKT